SVGAKSGTATTALQLPQRIRAPAVVSGACNVFPQLQRTVIGMGNLQLDNSGYVRILQPIQCRVQECRPLSRWPGQVSCRHGANSHRHSRNVMAKTTCPVTRQEFRGNAKPVKVMIGEIPIMADVKEFSTGSLGWYANGKTTIEVNGKPVSVQIGLNLTIVGSKELPGARTAAAAE